MASSSAVVRAMLEFLRYYSLVTSLVFNNRSEDCLAINTVVSTEADVAWQETTLTRTLRERKSAVRTWSDFGPELKAGSVQ